MVSCLLEFSQPSSGLSTVLLDLNLKNSGDETPLALALNTGIVHLNHAVFGSGLRRYGSNFDYAEKKTGSGFNRTGVYDIK